MVDANNTFFVLAAEPVENIRPVEMQNSFKFVAAGEGKFALLSEVRTENLHGSLMRLTLGLLSGLRHVLLAQRQQSLLQRLLCVQKRAVHRSLHLQLCII